MNPAAIHPTTVVDHKYHAAMKHPMLRRNNAQPQGIDLKALIVVGRTRGGSRYSCDDRPVCVTSLLSVSMSRALSRIAPDTGLSAFDSSRNSLGTRYTWEHVEHFARFPAALPLNRDFDPHFGHCVSKLMTAITAPLLFDVRIAADLNTISYCRRVVRSIVPEFRPQSGRSGCA